MNEFVIDQYIEIAKNRDKIRSKYKEQIKAYITKALSDKKAWGQIKEDIKKLINNYSNDLFDSIQDIYPNSEKAIDKESIINDFKDNLYTILENQYAKRV